MEWTDRFPSVDGLYWVQTDCYTEIVEVLGACAYPTGVEWGSPESAYPNALWWGPLQPPPGARTPPPVAHDSTSRG